jgi:hypothetical protein
VVDRGDPWGYRATDVAVFHGVAYRQGSVDDPIWPRVALIKGENTILVHPDRLDEWFTSRWTFTWRGEPFEARGLTDDKMEGVYLGGDTEFATEHLSSGSGRWGRFPRAEISDLTQHRDPLLPRFRREQALMADPAKYRSGTFARFEGRVLPAADAVDEQSRLALTGPSHLGPLRVTLDEVEEWYTTTWTFRWWNEPFEVVDVTQGRIKGLYMGGQAHFAWDYLRLEPGTAQDYTILLPEESVTDLTEHREDLLHRWRDKQ